MCPLMSPSLNKDAIVLEPHSHHTLLASYIGRLKLRKKWTTLTHDCLLLVALALFKNYYILLKFTDRHLCTYEGEFEFKSI